MEYYTWLLKLGDNMRIGFSLQRVVAILCLWCACLSWAAQSTSSSPDLLTASLVEARRLLQRTDYIGADRVLRQTLARTPDSAEAHFLFGFTLFREHQPRQSLAEYTQGAKLRDPSPEDLLAVASDYIFLQDYTDAARWLTIVTQRAPKLSLAWYLLGRTEYNADHPADAERAFIACMRIDPRDVRAEYNLGLVYEQMQRPVEAIAAYKEAISWQQDATVKDPQPYLDLGMLLRHQGHVTEALPYLTTAARVSPLNPMAHQELGLVYEQIGKYEDAVGELKQAIALSPKIEALHFFLGRVYRRLGRGTEAAEEFSEAAKLSGSKSSDGVPNIDVKRELP
jgi:tetratricopeptide (TPR) repeat protein